jgi:hypothetical protein
LTPEKGRPNQHEDISSKHSKIVKKRFFSNTVNVSQLLLDGHQVDHVHPQLIPPICSIGITGRSKNPNSFILENNDELNGAQQIFINYTSLEELFDCNPIIFNS